MYEKLTLLHNSFEICKEHHREILPFINFRRKLVDDITYNCDSNVSKFNKVPRDSYACGIVNIYECLDANNMVDIVNDTLTKNEQLNFLNKT